RRVRHAPELHALLGAGGGDRLLEVLPRRLRVVTVGRARPEDRPRRGAVAGLALELLVGARLELLHGGEAAALLDADLALLRRHRREVYVGGLYARPAMGLVEQLERTNRAMIAFDLILGTGALLAPSATLRVLGHDEPGP